MGSLILILNLNISKIYAEDEINVSKIPIRNNVVEITSPDHFEKEIVKSVKSLDEGIFTYYQYEQYGDDDQNEESITDEEKTKESFPEVNELNEESERFDDQSEENQTEENQTEENQSEENQSEEIQTEEKEENSEKIA